MDDVPAVKKSGCVPAWLKPSNGGRKKGRSDSRAGSGQPPPNLPLNVDAIPGGLSGIQQRMAAMGHGSNAMSPPETEVRAPATSHASGAEASVTSEFVSASPPAAGARGSRPPKPTSKTMAELHSQGQPPSLMAMPKGETPQQAQRGQQAGDQQAASGAPMAGIGIRVRQSPNGERS